MNIPRSEFPNPQFRRDNWLCLNGEWEFEMDVAGEKRFKDEGRRDCGPRVVQVSAEKRRKLDGKIIVPFCPQSELSGIGYKGYMDTVWYRRDLTIPKGMEGKRIILHFGAVDHDATVFINGVEVGTHHGGYTPFAFDITDAVKDGENQIRIEVYTTLANSERDPVSMFVPMAPTGVSGDIKILF